MSTALQEPLHILQRIIQRVWRIWLQTWHNVSIYLPLLMMGVLALGTWWLARNTPVFAPAEPDKPAKHEADYFMRRFAIKNFDNQGQLISEIAGENARHFGDSDVLEIDQARMRSWKQGRLSTATANRAYSNGDGSEVQLVGNAVVVREAVQALQGGSIPQLEFRGDFLHAFVNEERLASHKSVTIKRGADTFSADSLRYSNLDRVVDLQGRVKVQMLSQPNR